MGARLNRSHGPTIEYISEIIFPNGWGGGSWIWFVSVHSGVYKTSLSPQRLSSAYFGKFHVFT